MKISKRTVLGAATAVVAVAGLLVWVRGERLLPATSQARAAPEQFVGRPAGNANESRQIIALGRLEPSSRTLRINSPTGNVAGRIAEIRIAEGDRVAQGQVLAVLDTEPALAATLAQAGATAAMKKAQLALRIIELENTEKSLAASVEQQTAERDRAQWEFERHSHLKNAGLYSDPALIDKRLALLSANRRLQTSHLALERAQARDEAGARLDEKIMRADMQAALAAAEKARADHELSFIRAPIAGRILRLAGRLGQQIATDGFADMGDTDVMMVRAEVFESDVHALAPGQPATIMSRALEGLLHGSVSRIGLIVGTQSIIREDPAAVLDARVVEVFVRLDRASSARVSGLTNLQVRVAIPRVADRALVQTSNAD